MTRKIEKNSILSIIKTISSIVFPLFIFAYVSRVLSVDNVGKVNYSNSIVSYFSLLAALGIGTYGIRLCSTIKNDKEELNRTASQLFSINILSTLLSYLILSIVLIVASSLEQHRIIIIIASANIILSTLGADWINTAFEDYKYITIRTLCMQIITLVLVLVFVRSQDDYIQYVLISLVSSGGANVLNIFYRRKYCKMQFTFDLNIKKHLPPILLLFLMLSAQIIFTSSDLTIIGTVLGDYSAGIYGAAIKIYNIVSNLLCSITFVVLPSLSKAYFNDDIASIKESSTYAFDFLSTLGIPATFGLFFLSSEIIVTLIGASYLDAVLPLQILSISLLVNVFCCFIFNINLLASGKDKLCTFTCILSAIINLVGNIIFIPMFGIIAAAITTMLSQIIILFIGIPFIDKRLFDKKMFKDIPIIILLTLFIVGEIYLFRFLISIIWLRLLLSVIIGIIAYFGLGLLFKNRLIVKYFNLIKDEILKITHKERQ